MIVLFQMIYVRSVEMFASVLVELITCRGIWFEVRERTRAQDKEAIFSLRHSGIFQPLQIHNVFYPLGAALRNLLRKSSHKQTVTETVRALP